MKSLIFLVTCDILVPVLILTCIIFAPIQAIAISTSALADQENNGETFGLPTALNTYMFDDLPFAQRRQALREEVENKSRSQRPEKH